MIKNFKLKIKNYLVSDVSEGIKTAKEILYRFVDKDTVLFLSGGKTPKDLYQQMAEEKRLFPGAVGLVDERFGEKLHDNSNEKMIKETGLISYLKDRGLPFYPIITGLASDLRGREAVDLVGRSGRREKVTELYNQTLEKLFSKFKKRVAILGIGVDGHIAGIPAKRCHPEFISGSDSGQARMTNGIPKQVRNDIKNLVMEYNDKDGFYKQRVTMTFKTLSQMDLLLVLVFGEEKRKALELAFTKGSIEEIPARFLRRKGIAEKTILITDQRM